MEKLYCKNLINSLAFHQLNVRMCTTLCVGKIISNYSEKTANELAEKIIKTRENIQKNLNDNIFPEECKECIHKKK